MIINPELSHNELVRLRKEFHDTVTPVIRNLKEPLKELRFKDGSDASDLDKTKKLILSPIKLSLNDPDLDVEPGFENQRNYSLVVGIIPI